MKTVAENIENALDGSIRSLARLITAIENRPEAAREISQAVHSRGGTAHVVGLTGPPGSGKSSLTAAVAQRLRQSDKRVAIVAIDPTSPFTGGALLGDRVRMQTLSGDPGVFIRSMASRGRLGGLAQMSGAVVELLDAVGFDVILVETVGAGQAEIDIAGLAHTTIVIEAPGMGDEVQSIKAGILEIADILVVNKADRPGASRTVNALRSMLQLGGVTAVGHHGFQGDNGTENAAVKPAEWSIPVVKTSATAETGIDELVDLINGHRQSLQKSGTWGKAVLERSQRQIEVILFNRIMTHLNHPDLAEKKAFLMAEVARRKIDPFTAADLLFDEIAGQPGLPES